MDELAARAGRDPVEFRLAHLSDPRACVVVDMLLPSDWESWTPADAVGHGIGYGRCKDTSAYCAVVAEVEAVQEVRVRRLTIAVDAGLVINPDGAANQIEGGAIQSTSWTLKERVRSTGSWSPAIPGRPIRSCASRKFRPSTSNSCPGPTTRHWESEVRAGRTAAYRQRGVGLLGVRVRSLPLTPEQIVAAMPT